MSSTSFDILYQRFFDEIEKDDTFFNYFQLSNDEAMEVAISRADSLLNSAIDFLTAKCTPDVNFRDIDKDNSCFNFELTSGEISLIAKIMFQEYIGKDVVHLKTMVNLMTASDIKTLYSPANERNSFMNMYKDLQKSVEILIADYVSKDRLTGKRKKITYRDSYGGDS